MIAERAELRLVRESLEAVVAPAIVSTVIFEALARTGGALPDGLTATLAFVDGALRATLRARLGDEADLTIDGVLQMIASISTAAAPSAKGASGRGPSGREAEITRELVLDARPVIVCVVASTPTFAMQLQAALGAARVMAVAVPSLEVLTRQARTEPPHIVLIDAADFAPIEPDQLAGALERLSATTVRAIWGADLPFGAAVLRALTARRAPATPFDRREGIDPLLDLIRSRRAV